LVAVSINFVTHNDVLQDGNEADSSPGINQSALVLELETCKLHKYLLIIY
jgi:hypothetical protein